MRARQAAVVGGLLFVARGVWSGHCGGGDGAGRVRVWNGILVGCRMAWSGLRAWLKAEVGFEPFGEGRGGGLGWRLDVGKGAAAGPAVGRPSARASEMVAAGARERLVRLARGGRQLARGCKARVRGCCPAAVFDGQQSGDTARCEWAFGLRKRRRIRVDAYNP
ncbi:uncharacterized protein A4U43_C09F7240 [Asparagus officinalis]|uniref:Uncharacterized protein n=1 Tax=Asparagus officinalis TaxID=4686 RepID=A0A5P1E5X3_ASPOF|nr:uncharacterized protein A4U43_C09F7240 [Asparagus officinalis]